MWVDAVCMRDTQYATAHTLLRTLSPLYSRYIRLRTTPSYLCPASGKAMRSPAMLDTSGMCDS